MSPALGLLLIVLVLCTLLVSIILLPWYWDRIVVWLLWMTGLPWFPNAMKLADNITQWSEPWVFVGTMALRAPGVEITLFFDDAVLVEMQGLAWRPNAIERRIIGDAIDARRRRAVTLALNERLRHGPLIVSGSAFTVEGG